MQPGESLSCPVCGAAPARHIAATISPFVRERCRLPVNAEGRSHLCEACEHVFLTPLLSDAELRRLYHGYRGAEYDAERVRLEPDYVHHIPGFANVDSPHFQARRGFYDEFHGDHFGLRGLVVDAGDGEGYFGRYAYPLADVVALSRTEATRGVVIPELMAAADVLFIAHVLQQAPRPVEALARLTRFMRPGAEVWIEAPVQYSGALRGAFGSLAALAERGVRPAGPLATLHENLAHFSLRSLRRLCERAGLAPREFVRSGIGVAGVLATRTDVRLDLPALSDESASLSSVLA